MKSIPQLLVLVTALHTASPVSAQEFRIETVVTRGDDSETISENLTLLDDNLIVDFMLKTDNTRFPVEVVAYVINEKRFVLMDTTRKVKTELIESDLLQVLTALRNASFINDDNRFFFHPKFEESYDDASGWLELRSPRLVYRTRGKRPAQELALHRYFEFIDQFARLNATDPRRMPPFPRLKLNQSIKKYGFIPDEVEITLYPDADGTRLPIKMKSTHVVMWELSEQDRERIKSAKRYWMEFEEVPLNEYRKLSDPDAHVARSEDTGQRP